MENPRLCSWPQLPLNQRRARALTFTVRLLRRFGAEGDYTSEASLSDASSHRTERFTMSETTGSANRSTCPRLLVRAAFWVERAFSNFIKQARRVGTRALSFLWAWSVHPRVADEMRVVVRKPAAVHECPKPSTRFGTRLRTCRPSSLVGKVLVRVVWLSFSGPNFL